MTQVIDSAVRRFLDTRQRPRHLATDAAAEDMIGQIVSTISKHAPDSGLEQWVGEVIEGAMIRQRGNAWPSVDVWAKAVGVASGKHYDDGPRPTAISHAEQSFQLMCQRVAAGGMVSEHFVFGLDADRGLEEQRFSLDRLRQYQKAHLAKRASMYGWAKAWDWLRDKNPATYEAIRREDGLTVDHMKGGD